jgi:2C-methyl-D-erythritol 2,4-cyclodiphosphate synthase
MVEPVGNLADDVDIMAHASALGASFLGAVDFGDGGTVINPENDTAG